MFQYSTVAAANKASSSPNNNGGDGDDPADVDLGQEVLAYTLARLGRARRGGTGAAEGGESGLLLVSDVHFCGEI